MPDSGSSGPKDRVDALIREYDERVPKYRDFAATSKELIERLLWADGIRVHSVTARAKTPESLRGKLMRPDRQYASLDDVTDLAGVRIITFFGDDVDAVGRVIEREFAVIPEESVDRREAIDPDRFGYLSLHYVCTIPEKRASLPEYAPYAGYVCEIQVRSILQHAWAEIEHDLGYKAAQGIPRQIRRRFSRLASLLEMGDEEFMTIRDELATYSEAVKTEIVEKPGEVLLDKVSLRAFIEHDETVQRIDKGMAEFVGAQLEETPSVTIERYIEYFLYLGMNTIEELRAALVERERTVLDQYRERIIGEFQDSLYRGISLFHLWEVLLAEEGDAARVVEAFNKFLIDVPENREQGALEIVEAVRSALDQDLPQSPEGDGNG